MMTIRRGRQQSSIGILALGALRPCELRLTRGALPRDRGRTSNNDEHGASANYRSWITEPEKTVLGSTTPVARERAPTD